MDKQTQFLCKVWMKFLIHPQSNWACHTLFTSGSRLILVSKRGPGVSVNNIQHTTRIKFNELTTQTPVYTLIDVGYLHGSFSVSLYVGPQRNMDCYTPGRANEYHGKVNMTNRGRPCLRWDDSTSFSDFPDASIAATENYCRNPAFFEKPWCLIGPGKFGYCPVDKCLGL